MSRPPVDSKEAPLELGPEPPPDDIDGRSSAVIVWHDGDMFYLIASGEMSAGQLMPVAVSMYPRPLTVPGARERRPAR